VKVLVIGNVWPHAEHTVRAANVVVFELLRALSKSGNGEVGYLKVRRHSDPEPANAERHGAHILRDAGVTVLDELSLPPPPFARPVWKKLLIPRRSDYYPECDFGDLVATAIREFAPDMLLVPWSEWITALCANLDLPKFAYYGNPDHKAGMYRIAFDRRNGIPTYPRLRSTMYLHYLEQAHLGVMRRYDLLGNVAANDAAYYVRQGHPRAFYIHNVWIDRFGLSWQQMRSDIEQYSPTKIIANVGQLGGTANRYGLELLGRQVAPALREVLRDVPYELHILGKGELIPPLAKLLTSPEIRVRGFVEDIDQELLQSSIFLCLNNGSPYKVGHTRYLHAWSLGCAVVAHDDATLSMPEIRDGYNALLGRGAVEIAVQVKKLIDQPALRLQLGMAGYKTFRAHFVADRVAEEIWQSIYEYFASSVLKKKRE
jgi:glycosyltransferase involved in cell wall biosynthesis